jgi:hypothetical protein
MSRLLELDALRVGTTDGTPFTVDVKLAQSASQVDNFAVGGTVLPDDLAGPNASAKSATHYSRLPSLIRRRPVLQGAGWKLAVGTGPGRAGLLRRPTQARSGRCA